jgi:3-phosphoglycerate kinase
MKLKINKVKEIKKSSRKNVIIPKDKVVEDKKSQEKRKKLTKKDIKELENES